MYAKAKARLSALYGSDATVSSVDSVDTVSYLFASQTGSFETPALEARLRPDGSYGIEQVGMVDTWNQIQACRASTDMSLILSRYMAGDTSALSRAQGFYADISEMPENMHEALSVMLRAQQDFDALPLEVRERFGMDVYKYISELGTPGFSDKLKVSSKDASTTPIESEVLKNEQK